MHVSSPTGFLARTALGLFISVALSRSVSAAVIADLIDSPFGTSSAPTNSIYDTASLSVFLDPANTNWMALSIRATLSTTLPNTAGIPTIQSSQMDDAILLTASIGTNTSSQITLDDNNAFNLRVGNQAVFYGSFNSVGSFNGFTIATYGAQPESGALSAFFDTNGAGTYTLSLSFLNRFAFTAGHSNVFLLRDVTSQAPAVPEPSTLVLWSLGAVTFVCLGWRRRKRAA